jgi:hypothetical protein
VLHTTASNWNDGGRLEGDRNADRDNKKGYDRELHGASSGG